MIQSPLNYIGGKFKLLPQILPLFPNNIHTFVDLFCGGANVGINVNCKSVILNDINQYIIGIIKTFKELEKKEIFENINNIISKFNLSDVSKNGYDFYGCNSSNGVGQYNKNAFLKLKKYFNQLQIINNQYYIILYVLIVYSFNNQIRFNKKGEFNLPVGKRDFNTKMQKKLNDFIDRLKQIDCKFSSFDFCNINITDKNDFVYVDPPYLITCATYNEQGGWNEIIEKSLYNYLDSLNLQGIKFALSNVLSSKGKINYILRDWLDKNHQFTCHHLNYNYSNSNYQTSGRLLGSDEVLITNY